MPLATIMDAEREYVRNVGFERQDQAWIASDRDAWYPNPWYVGASVPHPESWEAYYADQNEADDEYVAPTEADWKHVTVVQDNILYDEIPF